MFVHALDPEMIRRAANDEWLVGLLEDYGLGALKAASLLTPVRRVNQEKRDAHLGEFQIVDSSIILCRAAADEGFCRAILNGALSISYFHKQGFAAALEAKMLKDTWISSSWPKDLRPLIIDKLRRRDFSPLTGVDSVYEQMWAGVHFFQMTFDTAKDRLSESGDPTWTLGDRLKGIALPVSSASAHEDVPPRKKPSALLGHLTEMVPSADRELRSAYVAILDSEDLIRSVPLGDDPATVDATRKLIFQVSQERIASAISDGNILRTLGVCDMGSDSTIPSNARPEQYYPAFSSDLGIDADFAVDVRINDLMAINQLSWDEISRVKQDALYSIKLAAAQSNGNWSPYLEWLKKALITSEPPVYSGREGVDDAAAGAAGSVFSGGASSTGDFVVDTLLYVAGRLSWKFGVRGKRSLSKRKLVGRAVRALEGVSKGVEAK